MNRKWPIIAILLCFTYSSGVVGQGPSKLISDYGNVNQFMKLVVQRMDKNEKNKLESLTYNATRIANKTDDSGKLVKTDGGKPDELNEHILIYGENAKKIMRVVERNGKKIDEALDQNYALDLNDIISTKYDFVFPYDDYVTITGKNYIIVDFRAKKNLAVNKRVDHIINRSMGRLYIDADNLLITKLEAWIPNEFTLGALWFKVYSARIVIEQQEFDGINIEKIVTLTGRYRNGWFAEAKNLNEVYTFYNYTRIK